MNKLTKELIKNLLNENIKYLEYEIKSTKEKIKNNIENEELLQYLLDIKTIRVQKEFQLNCFMNNIKKEEAKGEQEENDNKIN